MKLVPAIAAVAAATFALSACGADEEPAAGGDTTTMAPTTTMEETTTEAAAGDGVTTADDVFGPACSQLPQGDEPGSLQSMGPQPVATAASTNPLLTKLVAAVGAVDGLADTLNGAEALTVFAPADPAFEALGEEKFAELAANPDMLAPILQYHVVPMRYDAEGLQAAGTVESLNAAGGPLTIEGEGDSMTVNGAKVLCGNIPTANATVFVIDTVMTPGA